VRIVPLAFGLVLLLAAAMAQKASPVGVLYTGDPYPGLTPYIYMKSEPFLRVTPVQASRDHYAGISSSDIKRAIRIYMPRTYDELVRTYDVIIISDSNVHSFTRQQLEWFRRAVVENYTGLVMVGGHETFGGAAGNPDWGPTPVGDVLPVETVAGAYEGGKVKIVDRENEFMKSLPWRPDLRFLQSYDCNIVQPKEGARVLAVDAIDRSSYAGWENPFFSTWIYHTGRVFTMTGDWTPGGGWLFMHWEYLPDFVTNLMLYCAGRPIPQDLELVHTVRQKMSALSSRKIIITSLVEFVERFGANPNRILRVVSQVDEARKKATDLYLQQDFQGALVETNEALKLMDEAEALSEKVKKEALMWVYLIEWLSVTATALLCGFVLWTVMIRRRLYREVTTTTFR